MDRAVTVANSVVNEDEITISYYQNEIPSFIEYELAQLYGSLHSSLQFFKVFRSIENASCYVARRGKHPIAILVFHINGGRLDVLNEMLELEPEELVRFTRYIFAKLSNVNVISFKALKADTNNLGLPVQRSNAKDTYAISLPGTPEEYTASLGQSTRSTTRHRMNKIVRDYPSFSSRFYVNDEIDEQHLREIMTFNQAKISSKAHKFSYDEQRIIRLSKMCGFVNVISIDGRVCAGTINYKIGDSIFGEVLGYDPAYEKSGVGRVALYLTICESIVRGGKKFYLGGGRFDFKSRMLGTHLEMDSIEIYRSPVQVLLNLDKAASAAINGYIRRTKVWMHTHKENTGVQLAFKSFYFWKNLSNK